MSNIFINRLDYYNRNSLLVFIDLGKSNINKKVVFFVVKINKNKISEPKYYVETFNHIRNRSFIVSYILKFISRKYKNGNIVINFSKYDIKRFNEDKLGKYSSFNIFHLNYFEKQNLNIFDVLTIKNIGNKYYIKLKNVVRKFDIFLKKIYNNGSMNYYNLIDVYFPSVSTMFNSEKEEKYNFIKIYSTTGSLFYTMFITKVCKEKLDNWLITDKNFVEIYDWIKKHKLDLLEFMIFAKAGVFGNEAKKYYKNVNVNYLLNYARLLNGSNNRFTTDIKSKDTTTNTVLGEQETKSDISVEEE